MKSRLLLAAIVGLTLAACKNPPAEPVASAKPSTKAVASAKARAFNLKSTDKLGKEKVAEASAVKIKVNGVAVKTTVTDVTRSVLSLPADADPKAKVEIETKGGTIGLKVSDIPVPTDKKPDVTVWALPFKSGEFMGQVGPETKPMTAMRERATILTLDQELPDADLVAAYLDSLQLPRHIVISEGKQVMMDASFAFPLKAAKDAGNANPVLRLLKQDEALTVKVKAWTDEAPAADADGLVAFRDKPVEIGVGDVTVTVEKVTSREAYEKDVVKLKPDLFPDL